jgi:hypothetical protein
VFGEIKEDLHAHPLHENLMGHRILHRPACQHGQGVVRNVARQNFEHQTQHWYMRRAQSVGYWSSLLEGHRCDGDALHDD